ncbi:MAG: hypothetical protein AAFR04_09700 [Pseudomonadota bacterium]
MFKLPRSTTSGPPAIALTALVALTLSFASTAPTHAGEIAFSVIGGGGQIDVPVASKPRVKVKPRPSTLRPPALTISVAPAVAAQICALSRKAVGQQIAIQVGCRTISRPVVIEPLCGQTFTISVPLLGEATFIAETIRKGSPACKKPLS